MAVVKNLMVRAGADFSAITKQATKASKSMRGMQTSVSRSCDLMTKATRGVKKVLGAIGIGLSAAALINFSKDAAAAYDTQVQGEMRLATVMRKTMGASNAEIQSILDLTSAQQQLGIVGDEAQLAGAQQLSTYLHLTGSLKTLIPVMNDLAVQQYGLNVSEEQAVSIAKIFGKAMKGQTSALTRYGFTVSAAEERVLKYGTEAERAATLAGIVSQRVGGMNAAMAATPSGRMQQLSNALGDIKEQFGQAVRTIGTVFLPILNAVGRALSGIATIANKVAQTIANVFGGSAAGKEWQWAGVSAGISDTADAMDDLTDAQNGSASAAKRQKKELQTLSFDTLNILKTNAAESGGSIGGGGYSGGSWSTPISETDAAADEAGDSIGWLQDKLEGLKTKWEDFKARLDFSGLKRSWGELKEAIGTFGKTVGEILGPVWEKILKPLAVWTINKALPATLQAVAGGIDFVATRLKSMKESHAQVMDSLKTGFQNLRTSLVDLGKRIKDAWNDIKGSFIRGGESIGIGVQNLVNAVRNGDRSVIVSVADLAQRIRTAWSDIKNSFTRGGESIKTGLQNLNSSIKGIAKGIFEAFTWPFREAYNTVAELIKKIREKLNFSWTFPRPKLPRIKLNWDKFKFASLSIPIPKFSVEWYAKGGVFDRASLIGVGENGKEAVVPLEKNTGWISKVATELAAQMAGGAGMLGGEALIEGIHDAVYEAMMAVMGGQSRGGSHKTVVNVNGREFYRATWEDYKAVARERGVSLVNT